MTTDIRSSLIFAFSLASIVAIATASGCQRVEFASVNGLVTLDGKPIPDVEVQFLPVPNQRVNHPPTSAYTDADGEYTIVGTKEYGVLVGIHNVCINDATVMMPKSSLGADDGMQPSGDRTRNTPRKSRIPRAYSDSSQTPFNEIEIPVGSHRRDFAMLSSKGDSPRSK